MSAGRGADRARWAWRWLGPGVAALALAFLAVQLYAGWGEVSRQSFRINYIMLFLSGLFFGASYFLTALVWTEVLRALGTKISWRKGFRIMYLAELGKYLPGKVWSYAGLVYLGEQEGLGGSRALLGSLMMLALQTLVGLAMVVGGYAVWSGRFHAALLAVGLAALVGAWALLHPGLLPKPFAAVGRWAHGWRGEKTDYPAAVASSYADRARLLALVALNWLVAGAGMYLFINAFYGLEPGDLPLVVAIYAASWLSGYYSLIVPSGLGVREAVQAYSLTLIVPWPVAVFLALATRLWLTLGDLGAAAVAWRTKG